MFISLLAFGGLFGLLGILCFIFWLWMLVDCLQNTRLQGTEKLIWVLVIIFLPFLGSLLYFFLAKEQAV